MAKQTSETQPETPASPQTAIAQQQAPKQQPIQVVDESEFSNLLDTGRFNHLWRVAQMFADSGLMPTHFQGHPANCFIAAQMAVRMGVDPFMFMQNTYIVHGRPGMEAKLAIALINSSGLFTDSLNYEIEGSDPFAKDYRVRATAIRKSTGKLIEGPWIDWSIVRAEKWDAKDGSKWKTMPGMMFLYRAATWFGRVNCPERLMGMMTADEAEDAGPIQTIHVQNLANPVSLPKPGRQPTGKAKEAPEAPPATGTQQEAASGQGEADKTPPAPEITLDDLIAALVASKGVTKEIADQSLRQHAMTHYKGSLASRDQAARKKIATDISNGDVKIVAG